MKRFYVVVFVLLAHTAAVGQKLDAEKSKSLPPIRGHKDLRPKQFPRGEHASFRTIDLSSKITGLNRLKMGEKEEFALGNLTPLRGILISRKQNSLRSSYAFRIENKEYHGAVLFIDILKQKGGTTKYVGHVIRAGYSDVLKLQDENGRLYFTVEETQKVVLD